MTPVHREGPHQQTIWDKWQSERLTSAEDDSHSHSFMGLGRWGRTRPDDSFGIQKATVARREPVWTGINYQSVYGPRGPKLFEWCWQITPEILSMNARGQTPLALTLATAEIQIRVHLISRLALFMSAQSSPISPALSSRRAPAHGHCPSVNKSHVRRTPEHFLSVS